MVSSILQRRFRKHREQLLSRECLYALMCLCDTNPAKVYNSPSSHVLQLYFYGSFLGNNMMLSVIATEQ